MKLINKTIRNIITTFAIAALILTGSAPYFAFAEPADQAGSSETEVTSLATFDDSKVPDVSGGSVVLMNAENGDIIYEKNSHVIREPASVTKILNFLVVADELNPKQEVTVPEGVETRGTIVALQPGEVLTVEQLMYCMMLKSGNDAAEVLGNLAGGDQRNFALMMNEKAKACGALDTDYKNPNGLNEVEGKLNYTTAYDQAMITREALKRKIIRKVVSTSEYTVPKTNKSKARELVNSNACLWNDKRTVVIGDKNIPLKYTGCTGVKTGYTTSAGACYVGAAKRDGMELIVVSLHAPDSSAAFADAIKLWDYGFDHYKTYCVKKADKPVRQLSVKRGSLEKVNVGLEEDFALTVDKEYKVKGSIVTDVKIKDSKPAAPISKGAVMGTIEAYSYDGQLVGVKNLVALEDVEKGGPLSYIGIADESLWKFFLIVGLVIACLIALLIIVRRINIGRRKKRRAKAQARKAESVRRQPAPAPEQTVQRGPQMHREPPLRTEAARRSESLVGNDYDRMYEWADRDGRIAGRQSSRVNERTRREKRKARKARARRRKKRNVRD